MEGWSFDRGDAEGMNDLYNEKVLEVVKRWKTNLEPEYREFKCGQCGKKIRKAWHVWLYITGFKLEVHFCKKCWSSLNK